MKTVLIILSLFIVACVLLLFVLGGISRSGKAPGLVAGRLARCPDTPNCVCSEQQDDSNHSIAPNQLPQVITFDPLAILKNVVKDMGGTIRTEKENYFAATFTSAIFGFTDDFEVRIDSTQKIIHIRSASRVGYGDAGVNKERVELFKKLYNQKVSEANL
ncbi:MAG: DUF1499 domain-containing protein [Proteobacteria bacterium]|jgi:uncharacterized protein (DUF1499 family)|nr:DUF1499 domain-containing protein [Desulfocapsa sp.]MBU3946385.1 DUF1499 domain-containing protein [Pseudomonadota bacterium]MCG2743773.1 DUF1499 domain-containing protein [Desulfobacteraceae bacterium]MBU4027274.1 DUF1499 domain-containing protein [Pseudomonadota bacterium]MBU4041408.1 DUF1499 domain-containing protein [Pseudomonadota bacterium]